MIFSLISPRSEHKVWNRATHILTSEWGLDRDSGGAVAVAQVRVWHAVSNKEAPVGGEILLRLDEL